MKQLPEDIYLRRFKEQLIKKEVDVSSLTESQLEEEATRQRNAGIPPSIAVTKCFTTLCNKRDVAEQTLPTIIKGVCTELSIEFDTHKDGDSKTHRDMRSMVCWIAVSKLNLRPHTVIKEHLGFSSNSNVNHAVYRCASYISDSAIFAEKLKTILDNLKIETSW